MTGYTPEQMPVLSTLARGFAIFDHWFADVPSQTFTNRSFFHAATSSGLLVNAPYGELPGAQHRRDAVRPSRGARPDLADLLRPAVAVLPDRGDPCPAAARPVRDALLLDRPVLRGRRATASCPTYSFIEPQIIGHAHNDMHPAYGMQMPGPGCRSAVVADRRGGPAGPDLQRDPLRVVADRLELAQHPAHGRLRRARRAPTTTSLRPPPSRPTRPAPQGRWTSGSTGSAFGCPPSRSRRGSLPAPWSTTPTGTPRSSAPCANAGTSASP